MNPPRPQMGIPAPNGPGPGLAGMAPPVSTQGYSLKLTGNGYEAQRNTLGRRGRPMPPPMAGPRGLGGTQFSGPTGYSPFKSLGDARQSNPAASVQGVPAVMNRMSGGVRPGENMMGGPSVQAMGPSGPSLEQIQAEMARRKVGAQLGARNGALAGYMMAK